MGSVRDRRPVWVKRLVLSDRRKASRHRRPLHPIRAQPAGDPAKPSSRPNLALLALSLAIEISTLSTSSVVQPRPAARTAFSMMSLAQTRRSNEVGGAWVEE